MENNETTEVTKTRKTKDPEGKGRSSFCIDATVLENAKIYAKDHDMSLSALIESALSKIVTGA